MATLTHIQNTTAGQIGAPELHMAHFTLVSDGTHTISAHKGHKYVKITYQEGSDTYKVHIGKMHPRTYNITEEIQEMVYADELRSIISQHFKFEYVMHRIMGVRA